MKIIGALMILAPCVWLYFTPGPRNTPIREQLIILGLTIGMTAWIVVAAYLITK